MEQCSNVTNTQTSSLVSTLASTLGFDLLANFGAFTFDKHSCLSGGGPPRGCPRITTLSPERTFNKIKKNCQKKISFMI